MIRLPDGDRDESCENTPDFSGRGQGTRHIERAAVGSPDAAVAYRLLAVKDVAAMLNCSPRSVAAWTASGELASVKLGGLRRYRLEDVEEFIKRNLCKAVPASGGSPAPDSLT